MVLRCITIGVNLLVQPEGFTPKTSQSGMQFNCLIEYFCLPIATPD